MLVQIRSFKTLFEARRRNVLRAVAVALVGLSLSAMGEPANAADRPLDAPRAAGIVGERWDGFAEVRETGAPADITALVTTTNNQRRQVYQKRAAAENTTVTEVGKVYAGQILKAAPAGTWSLAASGTWSRK